MHTDYSLLAPGPVNLHPEVRRILSEPMIHHRTPQFDRILSSVLSQLKKIFVTEQAVFIHTSTGSGGMESLVVNTLSPGDQVLVVVSGKFGERWAEMAQTYGAQVKTLEVPWGQAIDPQKVSEELSKNPNLRAIFCQACETSSGVAHPIEELGKIIANYPQTLFLVDGITALGAYPLPMDSWKIDGLVGGSQKAFMLPTGMSFVSFSKKAWSFVEKAQMPRYYFDVRKEKKANEKGETFFSSPVAHIRALEFVLNDILKSGLDSHFQTIHRRAEMTRAAAGFLGLKLFSQAPSDSLSALMMPASVDGQKVRQTLEDKYQITVMGGQDQAKGKILRIGHMGYIQDSEMLRLFECLGHVLQSFLPNEFTKEKLQLVQDQLKKWIQSHP